MPEGVFITVEGAEGVGKSSFCQGLSKILSERGINVVLTREPGGTALADRIRSLFADPGETIEATTELFLVSAARSQHVSQLILPKLKQGHWVLCDRFYDSSFVYQGFLGGIDASFIAEVSAKASFGLVPRISFLLDCDPELCYQRLAHRYASAESKGSRAKGSTVERYDHAEKSVMEKMREGYLAHAARHKDRFHIIHSSGDKQETLGQGLEVLHRAGLIPA